MSSMLAPTVAPRRVGVAVAPEGGPVRSGLGAHLDHRLGLELGQVGGDLAVEGLADHAGGRVADARQLGQRAGPGPLLELGRVGGHDDVERPHPGLRLEAGHVGAVQAVDDPLQGLDGGHRARLRAAARTALAAAGLRPASRRADGGPVAGGRVAGRAPVRGLARFRRIGETIPRQTPPGVHAGRGLARVRRTGETIPRQTPLGAARAGPLASGRDPARRARRRARHRPARAGPGRVRAGARGGGGHRGPAPRRAVRPAGRRCSATWPRWTARSSAWPSGSSASRPGSAATASTSRTCT